MACSMEDFYKEKDSRARRLLAYNEEIKSLALEMSSVIVGELVSERKRQQMTQQDIADITGVQAPNVTRFESAKTIPTLVMLQKYAAALGKHVELNLVDD